MDNSQQWFVYIIEAKDKSLYTGITTDVQRRFKEHQDSKKGARYFRRTPPQKICHIETFSSRSGASKREFEIKKMSREEKLKLFK